MNPIFLLFLLIFSICYSQELNWEHTAGPMGGVIGDIGSDSEDNIYAGAYPLGQNGIYKSTDNGDSWNELILPFDRFQNYSIAVYSIYITKDDHIWVGTDNQGGPYLSTDKGITWQDKSNGYGANECWAIGESRDGVLFAGDGQYNWLYYSTDYGDNWVLSEQLSPLVFATDSTNKVYAGTFNGLYYTTDNGLSWTLDENFPIRPVATIVIDENNNIYCGTGYYNDGDGVFFSSDNGQSWEQLGLKGKNILSLAFDSIGLFYAGTYNNGLFISADLGHTWQQRLEGLYGKDIFRLKINQQDEVFIGAEGGHNAGPGGGGVFRSTNGGTSFEHIGLPISGVNDFVFSGDSLIITATPSGVQNFNRHTKRWKNVGLHIVESVAITPSNILYAATLDDGLYKSTDLGKNWSLTNLTKDSMLAVYNLQTINDDTLFAVTNYYLMRTTNGGTTWETLSINPADCLFFKNGTLWITGYISHEEVLFKSTDLGENFDSVYTNFSTYHRNSPIVAIDDGYIFLASRDGTGYNTELSGVVRSTNEGESWEQVLSHDKIDPIIYANNDGLVITSTVRYGVSDTNYVYISTNFGTDWTPLEQPTKSGTSSSIKQDPNGVFFFGTFGSGLYKVDIVTDVPENESAKHDFYLSQNFPNPFNPTTKIKFTIPFVETQRTVSLHIYDILGREVKTLINKPMQAGEYEVEFDGANLTSGVYFYRLQIGSCNQTNKMLLIK